MKTQLILLILALISLASCNDSSDTFTNSEELEGYWIRPEYTDSLITYERSNHFEENVYGIAFKRGGIFIERMINGWCGTPPVVLSDFEGKWSLRDSTINVKGTYWGGTTDMTWKIKTINASQLKIIPIKTEYHFSKD